MQLNRYARLFGHWPFWGLGVIVPEIQPGDGADWIPLVAATGYASVIPVEAGAVWFRALFAGPLVDEDPNPVGTIVVAEAMLLRFRAVGPTEVVVPREEWVTLE